MEKKPVTVMLDNVRSAQNAGALFRTGDAFAVERIVLRRYADLHSVMTDAVKRYVRDVKECDSPNGKGRLLLLPCKTKSCIPRRNAAFFMVYGRFTAG